MKRPQHLRSRRFVGLLKTKKEKNRLKHLHERVSSGHNWAENHARVGFWPFKSYKENNRPKNLRERASSGHRWAEKHARVGFEAYSFLF